MLRSLLAALAAVAALLFAPLAQATGWVTIVTVTSSGTGLGSISSNYVNDFWWVLPSASSSWSVSPCTTTGQVVVRHDWGGLTFLNLVAQAEMKAFILGRSITIDGYFDTTSTSTACDTGGSGAPAPLWMRVGD